MANAFFGLPNDIETHKWGVDAVATSSVFDTISRLLSKKRRSYCGPTTTSEAATPFNVQNNGVGR